MYQMWVGSPHSLRLQCDGVETPDGAGDGALCDRGWTADGALDGALCVHSRSRVIWRRRW